MRAPLVVLVLLAAPLAALPASAAPCTFVSPAYVCQEEEQSGDDCANEGATGSAFTSVAVGVIGTAGVTAGGAEWCSPNSSSEYVVASAGAGPAYVNAGWTAGSGGGSEQCFAWAYVNSLPYLLLPCAAGGPPNPGWGDVLP